IGPRARAIRAVVDAFGVLPLLRLEVFIASRLEQTQPYSETLRFMDEREVHRQPVVVLQMRDRGAELPRFGSMRQPCVLLPNMLTILVERWLPHVDRNAHCLVPCLCGR